MSGETPTPSVRQLRSDAKRRLISVEVQPGPNFRPEKASEKEIKKYNLAPPPNAEGQPNAYGNWLRSLRPPIRIVQPRFLFGRALLDWHLSRRLLGDANKIGRLRSSQSLAVAPGAVSESNNWSGVVSHPSAGINFRRIQGTWIVPNPYPQRIDPSMPWSDGVWRSAAWIGFDGYDPGSESLPQVGTAQNVSVANGTLNVETFAWFGWWTTAAPLPPIGINPADFDVRPGDLIYGDLYVVSPTEVHFKMVNLSTGLSFGHGFGPPNSVIAASPGKIEVQARSADWILERPTPQGGNFPDVLPNYGGAMFSRCIATIDPVSGPGKEQGLAGAALVTMRDPQDPTVPNAIISQPSLLADSAFMTLYRTN